MILPASILAPHLNAAALAHSLRPDIVMAIVLQESDGNTSAYRFEPMLYEKLCKKQRHELAGWKPKPTENPSLFSEIAARSMSWGLMQVLGETARWCAKCALPYLSDLCNPEIGLDIGCRVFSFYLGRAEGDYARALAMYNAGNPDSFAGKKYAQEVLTRIRNGETVKYLKGD